MMDLQSWSKVRFGNTTKELYKARRSLEEMLLNNGNEQEVRQLTDYMNELLYCEELSKYFHQRFVWRAKKNNIKKLKDSDGAVNENISDMQQMATLYFKEIFSRGLSLNSN
jgi:hypothetical protein